MSAEAAKLADVLTQVAQLLTSSQESDWTPFEPKEIVAVLERELFSLRTDNKLVNPTELAMLFAPTGPIQEISMANNWSKEYLALSEQVDALARD